MGVQSPGLSWKKLALKTDPTATLGQSEGAARLEALEKFLGLPLPNDLRGFLAEVGNMWACSGSCTVWSADEIEKQNKLFRTFEDFRSLYMPFDHLLFFGDDGCGDLFAYAIDADGAIRRPDVFLWEHETDERLWKARDLKDFLDRERKGREEIEGLGKG